jgi:hypothetical protein
MLDVHFCHKSDMEVWTESWMNLQGWSVVVDSVSDVDHVVEKTAFGTDLVWRISKSCSLGSSNSWTSESIVQSCRLQAHSVDDEYSPSFQNSRVLFETHQMSVPCHELKKNKM